MTNGKRYSKETSPLEHLWQEYQHMFAPDEAPAMHQSQDMSRYNMDLTLAMFGFGAETIQRRKKELEILRQELADIERSHQDAMQSLPSNEVTLEFFRPILAECAHSVI